MEEEKPKVRIDWFMADVANIDIPLTDELVAALISNAAEYLQVNGGITWEKWSLLSGASRAAFVEAASQIKLRQHLDVPT